MVTGSDRVPRRSHVERRVNEREAAVVRQIFDLCAAGRGIRTIAKQLNAEGAPCPRPVYGRPKAWAPSSVRAVLYRVRYRGEVEWNRTSKRDDWGLRRTQRRPREQWVCTQMPALRIVSEDLWTAAHDHLAQGRGVVPARYRRALVGAADGGCGKPIPVAGPRALCRVRRRADRAEPRSCARPPEVLCVRQLPPARAVRLHQPAEGANGPGGPHRACGL